MTGPTSETGHTHIYRAADRARPALLHEQPKPGEHVWIAIATFRVFNPEPLITGASAILDGDNLATVTTGCFVCEQPFHPSMLTQPCPGEPR